MQPHAAGHAFCSSIPAAHSVEQPQSADNVCSQCKNSQTIDAVSSYRNCDVAQTRDEFWRNVISTIATSRAMETTPNEIMLAMMTRAKSLFGSPSMKGLYDAFNSFVGAATVSTFGVSCVVLGPSGATLLDFTVIFISASACFATSTPDCKASLILHACVRISKKGCVRICVQKRQATDAKEHE